MLKSLDWQWINRCTILIFSQFIFFSTKGFIMLSLLHAYKCIINFIKVFRSSAKKYFVHYKNIICPLNCINEMKLKKDVGIHAFYKFISNLPTMDIMELIYKLWQNLKKKGVQVHRWLEPLYSYVVDFRGSTKQSISLNNWSYYQH